MFSLSTSLIARPGANDPGNNTKWHKSFVLVRVISWIVLCKTRNMTPTAFMSTGKIPGFQRNYGTSLT